MDDPEIAADPVVIAQNDTFDRTSVLQPAGAVDVLLRSLDLIAKDASLPHQRHLGKGHRHRDQHLGGHALHPAPAHRRAPEHPPEFYEGADNDGANTVQQVSKITLPLSEPIVIYTVLTSFIGPWVDFIFAKVICRANADQYTVAIGLWRMLEKEYIDNWYTCFAVGAVLISIPIALLFLKKWYTPSRTVRLSPVPCPRHGKPVVINDPGVKKETGYPVYEEGVEKGYFATTPEGEVYINAVWPGDAVFPDFGNPDVAQWWGEHQKFLLDLGVRGIWNDMNEPASFKGPLPDDVVFSDGDRKATHGELHNVYGHFMAKAAYEGLKKLDGRRPFVITRACYAGTQKYSTAWTGDNHSIWAHLQMAIPQLCNLGLSGMPFAGTDLGGFGSDTTPELLIRWVQTACFSPLFRNHSAMGTRRQEPWQFGPEVLDIYRKYVKLRYQWLPYFYDLFWEAERTGMPPLRPLVLHYPNDETAHTCNDEFMVGDRVLAAPVVWQGARRRLVYLPQGEWYDYWTREKLTGPVSFVREAPLELCPIYVKAGSVIPMAPPQSYVGEVENDTLLLDVYPGQGTWDHYLDDGESFDYRDGKYHQYRFTVLEGGGVDTEIVHAGYNRPYREVRVLHAGDGAK